MPDDTEWHFGPFRLEAETARLWRGAERLPLRPKSFAVLHYLLQHAGRLVPKDALLQAVWPDVAVSEAMLTICLSELRRVLGETRQAPQFIETVARRGYRFIGAVRQVALAGGAAGPAAPWPPPPTPPGLLVGRAAALAQVRAWGARAQQGERQVVFVTGESGLGKTTLVDAGCARLAVAGACRVGWGQCLDHHGAGEAYLPVLEALGQLCRGPEGAELVAQLAQYAPTWLLQLPAFLRPGDVEGLHRRVLGATQERMLRELAETLDVVTATQLLVLVLEDLHWSDAATLDLLAYLAQRGQFLRATGLEEWPDGTVAGRYGFIHGLYQQVLYDRLPVGRRTVLHRRLGARQEAAFGARAHEHAAALAVHFEGGREFGRAVHYRRQAADTALRRYAYREAVEHLTTALALLENLPETLERARQGLGLLIALGPPLSAVRGQAAPEVEHTYRRAHALCQQVGDIAQLAPALVGLRVWYSMRGMLQLERAMGEQLLDLAQRLQDPLIQLEAHRSLGMGDFMAGAFVAARRHLEQGLLLASAPQRQALPALHPTQVPGVHPYLECLVYLAYALWYLGYPDQALQRSQEAVHWAQVSSHPYSLALALASAAWVHQHRREASAAQELAEATMAIAAEHGFVQREAIASIRYGWTLAIQGQAQAGIGQSCTTRRAGSLMKAPRGGQ